VNVYTKQQRIAEIAKRTQKCRKPLTLLHHYIDEEWLNAAYKKLRKKKAPGIDHETVEEYGLNLKSNNRTLLEQAKSGRYIAPPVRGVDIPKPGSKEKRGLGIPTTRDKVLQKGVQMLLEPIYEEEFYNFSHAFRPKRNQHDALQHLWNGIMGNGIGWIIDLDIRKFFDTVRHDKLREMLRQRVTDGVITRLIGKWLKAGIMKDGGTTYSDEGTPQGGVISPLLSNIYLHEVLDKWFVEMIWPRLMGRSTVIRYADDAVLGFEYREDAEYVLKELHKRFNQYGLTLHPEKTRLVNFEKPSGRKERTPTKRNKPGTFTFLGFTHYWGKSQRGNWVIKRKTSKKKLTEKLSKMNIWCRKNRHLPLMEQHKKLKQKILGHYQYYGITGNARSLQNYLNQVTRIWKKWLCRRSWGNKKMNWERFAQMLRDKIPLPPIKIPHSVFSVKP
jgi:group II intron reverse transcriptase/maturase